MTDEQKRQRAIDAFCRCVSVDCIGVPHRNPNKNIRPYIGFLSDVDAAEAWNALNDLPERKIANEKMIASRGLKENPLGL